MIRIKQWTAGLLSVILLFSFGTAAWTEETGQDTVDIQESLVSREGETSDKTLPEYLKMFTELSQNEEVRSLLQIREVTAVASEVIWKVLVWMVDNRPVTMKILAELGLEEADLRCVEKLWDSGERIADAVSAYAQTEEGKKLVRDYEALIRDQEFRKSLDDLSTLLSSDDLGEIIDAIQETVEEGAKTGHEDGAITQEALNRQLDRTSFMGALLFSLIHVLEKSEWGRNFTTNVLQNENLWAFLSDLAGGNKNLDRTIREEMQQLSGDPELTAFIERTIYAVFVLKNELFSLKTEDPSAGESAEITTEEAVQ